MRVRFHELISSGEPFGVLAFGVDNFDRINNLFSYEFGDRVLENITTLMTELAPAGAETFRFDGDCFGTVVPFVADAADLQTLFDRTLASTCAGFTIDGASIAFGITGCACLYPANGRSAEELFRATCTSPSSTRSEADDPRHLHGRPVRCVAENASAHGNAARVHR